MVRTYPIEFLGNFHPPASASSLVLPETKSSSRGIINTFGVFQEYYESGQLFHKSSSDISWIGSIQSFLLLFVGSLTGPSYDAGYFRTLVCTGSFLVVFGHMMLSLCHEFWQVLLAQGFVVGIGTAALFVPSIAVLPTYFTTKIPIAIGISSSGSSLGTWFKCQWHESSVINFCNSSCTLIRFLNCALAFSNQIKPSLTILFPRCVPTFNPYIANSAVHRWYHLSNCLCPSAKPSESINPLKDLPNDSHIILQIGFPWATRVIAFIMLATLILPVATMKPRVLTPAKRKLFEFSAFRNPAYVTFVVALTTGFLGLFIPFYYIQFYAEVKHLTPSSLTLYLLAILNTGSIFGRIIPNGLAQKFGPLNILIGCVTITAIVIFTLVPIYNKGGTVVFCFIFGFFSGTFVSLPPTVFVRLSDDNRSLIGTRLGMGIGIASLGALAGTPIAGAILNHKGFNSVWYFSGGVIMGCALLVCITRFFKDNSLSARV